MACFGPISSIFDIATFALMWIVFQATTPMMETLFQSGWFIEGLMSQTLIVHMIRTRKLPIVESAASWQLTGMTGFTMAAGIFIVMGPLAHYFKLVALPLAYFGWLTVILVAYISLTQLMKGWYDRHFGW